MCTIYKALQCNKIFKTLILPGLKDTNGSWKIKKMQFEKNGNIGKCISFFNLLLLENDVE